MGSFSSTPFIRNSAISLTILISLLFFLIVPNRSPKKPLTTSITPHRFLLNSTSPPPPCSSISQTPPQERCAFSRAYCDGDSGLFNYSTLHFCLFNENPYLTIGFLALILLLQFYILVKTAQDRFSVVVTKLSTLLNLSPSMGAVTLLALGNGAPDVFASVAAVRGGHARIGFGAILSAGTFVSAFVVGFVAIYSAPFAVDPAPFVRDVFFYLTAAFSLFYVYLSAEIYLWQAIGFVGFYVFFVGFVFWMDLGAKGGRKKDGIEMIQSPKNCVEVVQSLKYYQGIEMAQSPKNYHGIEMVQSPKSYQESEVLQSPKRFPGIEIVRSPKNYHRIEMVQSPKSYHRIEMVQSPKNYELSNFENGGETEALVEEKPIAGPQGIFQKISKLWEVPVSILLKLTIPETTPSEWSRFYLSANIALCPLALMYSFDSIIPMDHKIAFLLPHTHFPLWLVVLFSSTSLAIVHYIVVKEPPETEQMPVVLVAFVLSVFWISTVAGELLNCLGVVGSILDLPPALLGLTVLAWGNSIGDLVADVAVAKAGQPAMAMAGCFAGPMFNMLVGLGTGMVLQTVDLYPEAYKLQFHISIVVAFVFLLLSLMGSLLVVTWYRFRVPRFWGFCLVGLYILFTVVSLLIATVSR